MVCLNAAFLRKDVYFCGERYTAVCTIYPIRQIQVYAIVMSNLRHVLDLYKKHPAVEKIAAALDSDNPSPRLQLTGLSGALESFVVAATMEDRQRKATGQPQVHLFLANSKEEAAYRLNDLQGLLGEQSVFFFPDSFKRPAFFDDLNQTQILQRSEVVHKISSPGGPGGAQPKVVVSYPEALFEKVVKPEVLLKNRIDLKKGERVEMDTILEVLVEYGFERTDFVYEPGQFSIRGGIVDLFSFGNELPYRIELFDDEVESIRVFDPLTQLSKQTLLQVGIVPNLNTRFRQDQKVSLLSVLPAAAVLWIKDFQFVLDRLQQCFEKAEQYAGKISALDAAEIREIFRDRAFLYPGEVLESIAGHPMVFMEAQIEALQRQFPGLI